MRRALVLVVLSVTGCSSGGAPFGWPCEGSADCESGLCIDSEAGRVCTRPCTTDCDCGPYACVEASPGLRVCIPGTNRCGTEPDAGAPDSSVPDTGTIGDDAGGPTPGFLEPCPDGVCETGLYCATDFPQPFCTETCTSDFTCGPSTYCFDGRCVPSCVAGRRDCDRFGGSCVEVDVSFCRPACEAVGLSTAACSGTLTCDPYRGTCGTSVASGAPNGAPCNADSDCRGGSCFPPSEGYVGGFCASLARSTGTPYVRGSCPAGSIAGYDVPVGDTVVCSPACTRQSDCRDGYYCGDTGTSGLCTPIDCDVAGVPDCPSGTLCATAGDGRQRCLPCAPTCAGRNCGDDGCGGTCGTCTGLDRCSTAGVCECVGETDATLCSRAGANCGSLTTTDGCGASRTIDCGPCAGTCGAIMPNRCCVPETDAALCTAASANCDTITVTDACGASRTPSCGTCTLPQTCGVVTANRCGCIGETVTELCDSRGATCGALSVTDRCGVGRSVSCGTCELPETCGGAGTPNTCGICVPSCGSRVCGNDGCGGSCGTCPSGQRCNASGACELIPCDPVRSTGCTLPQKCDWISGTTTACRPAGTGLGETPCTGSHDCAAEHTCSSSEAMCREYCTTSSDCRGGARCAFDLTGSPYGLCSLPCDPTDDAARAGTTGCSFYDCRILNTSRATEVTDCGPTGSRPTGSSCTSASQCFGGDTCHMGTCRAVCELGFACIGGGTCTTVSGWSTYGVCL